MTDPLQLPLQDVHLPAAAGWWPPAPGWWLVLGLLLLASAGAWWWRRRRQRWQRSAVYLARQELQVLQSDYAEHGDARKFVAELSVLLRRLSISAFPRSTTASLTGEAWLAFLDASLQEPAFSTTAGRVLIEAPYRRQVNADEVQALVELGRLWIDRLAQSKPVPEA